MKKRFTVRLILLAMALLLVLSACGNRLNGTYRSTGLIDGTITFKDDQATLSAFGLQISGPYKIEKDTITIHYSLLGLQYDWKDSFRKEGKSIFIGEEEFVKQ